MPSAESTTGLRLFLHYHHHAPLQSQEEVGRGCLLFRREQEGKGRLETSSKFVPSVSCPSSASHLSADTAFKQQRLKAWQPILTPKTVLPTLFIIGILFAPIGGLLIWGSSLVTEMTFDYSECENLPPSTNATLDSSLVDMPKNKFNYRLSASDQKNAKPTNPKYAFLQGNTTDVSWKRQCVVEFQIPAELPYSVFFYYKLTNFYQNHRRYVKSLNSDQLKGKFVSNKDLNNSDCKPLAASGESAIYPCGLIANSVFNGLSAFPDVYHAFVTRLFRHIRKPCPTKP